MFKNLVLCELVLKQLCTMTTIMFLVTSNFKVT